MKKLSKNKNTKRNSIKAFSTCLGCWCRVHGCSQASITAGVTANSIVLPNSIHTQGCC